MIYDNERKEIKPRSLLGTIAKFIDDDEIIAIHGARQVGKTSLLFYIIQNWLKKKIPPENIFYFDLEDILLLEMCNRGPDEVMRYLTAKGTNPSYKTFILIDEIQYMEDPSSFMKLFFDRYRGKAKLIVTGSSSFQIKKKFKNSLVGRIIEFELFPLDFEEFLAFKNINYNLKEIGIKYPEMLYRELSRLYKEYVLYGGFPAIVLEKDLSKKEMKLKQIINTYIRRDVRDLAHIKDIHKFNQLVRILASQSARLLNISELSTTIGLARKTVEEYIFILETTYILKRIYPFHRNLRSELTKTPKILMQDTGIMNILINNTFSETLTGQLFETSLFSILRKEVGMDYIYYWRTNKGQEVDFVMEFPHHHRPIPIEVKLQCLPKRLSHIKYFKEKYSTNEAVLCCFGPAKGELSEEVILLHPWQIYSFLNGIKEKDKDRSG